MYKSDMFKNITNDKNCHLFRMRFVNINQSVKQNYDSRVNVMEEKEDQTPFSPPSCVSWPRWGDKVTRRQVSDRHLFLALSECRQSLRSTTEATRDSLCGLSSIYFLLPENNSVQYVS